VWKVATWNVNSVNARIERLLAFLARERPDVVLLQELKCEAVKYPFEAIEAAGYTSAVFGQKTYNGVAILSRSPITNVSQGFQDGELDEARYLSATVLGVRVASAYIPNGQSVGSEKFQYKLSWLKRLRQHLKRELAPGTPLLLGGDFNVAPEDRDVHDPDAWQNQLLCSAAERSALQAVLATGMQDTFRTFCAEGGHYTWWDYRKLGFQEDKGLRIDFLLANEPLSALCRRSRIDRDERKGITPSDHAPVLAEFEL
jgi:exodeoxyribonuclease III